MAQALNRRALGADAKRASTKAALATATTALKDAKESKEKRLVAMSLFRLAEAQYRAKPVEKVLEYATEAAALFKALGDPSGQGRALWVVSMWRGRQGRAAEGNQAAAEALALCRSCGDLYGAGNALNMLVFHEPDLATSLKQRSLALADFEAAGYVERQAIITGNQGITYARSRIVPACPPRVPQGNRNVSPHGRVGARPTALPRSLKSSSRWGTWKMPRTHVAAMAATVNDISGALARCTLADIQGRLALRAGDAATALRQFERAHAIARDADRAAIGDRHADVDRARAPGAFASRVRRWPPRGAPRQCTARMTWRRSTACPGADLVAAQPGAAGEQARRRRRARRWRWRTSSC